MLSSSVSLCVVWGPALCLLTTFVPCAANALFLFVGGIGWVVYICTFKSRVDDYCAGRIDSGCDDLQEYMAVRVAWWSRPGTHL